MNTFPTARALQFAVFYGFASCFLPGATQKVAAKPAVPPMSQSISQPMSQPMASARFPFVMPWDDATKNAADVSFLNPAPLTNQHRVLVKGEHFADTTGRRVRFLGTNFAAGANFLSKSDAEKVAARLHKLGFNIIRLHHMDSPWAKPNIFGSNRDDYKAPNEIIAPASLDALDYLVFQLKQNGIYVDLNLHVGWTPNAASGYPDIEKIADASKALTYFDKKAIAHQREYARQFLTHVNPYTKTKWSDDPAVALIEITNEDSLLASAWDGQVAKYPPYYRDQLATRWNAFLKTKYGTTAKVKAAWQGNDSSHSASVGPNILQNSRFASDLAGWTVEKQEGDFSATTENVESSTRSPLGKAIHFDIRTNGSANWKQQFHQNGLTLQNGETYTVGFWAKADKERPLSVYAALDRDPWSALSAGAGFTLTPQWKRYSLTMSINGAIEMQNRLSFVLGDATGQLWLADLSVQRGFVVDLGAQTLENSTMEMASLDNTPRGSDMIAFLMAVENEYSISMRDFIKNDLKSKSLVTCSQDWLGGLGGVIRESRMDWVDMHSYWQHPEFPGTPWDSNNWRIPNTSMVRDAGGGTLPFLSQHRVAGKPFTVTEYNHPAPNDYAGETMPLIAAYGAAQDWDGLFLFDYHGDQGGWNDTGIHNYFNTANDINKMATLPAAALTFLRGQIAPAPTRTALTIPRDSVVEISTSKIPGGFWESNMSAIWNKAGWTRADLLNRRVAIKLADSKGAPSLNRVLDRPQNAALKSVLDWKTDKPESALFTVDATRMKSVVGFAGGQTVKLGGFQIVVEPTTRNFAVITLNARDDRALEQSTSLLLTASSNAENTGMIWNATRTSVGTNWGKGPMLAEGVPASVSLRTRATTATVYALDGRGARTVVVPSQIKSGLLQFNIGAQYRTLWYEIAASMR